MYINTAVTILRRPTTGMPLIRTNSDQKPFWPPISSSFHELYTGTQAWPLCQAGFFEDAPKEQGVEDVDGDTEDDREYDKPYANASCCRFTAGSVE